MNKTAFLDRVRSMYQPNLVSVDYGSVLKLGISPENAELVQTSYPFVADVDGKCESDAVQFSTALYLLGMTSLQYRFWELSPQGEFLRYSFDGKVGSVGLEYAFGQAWGNSHMPAGAILDAMDSVAGVKNAFGPDIPDPESRKSILNEVLGPKGLACAAEVVKRLTRTRLADLGVAQYIAEQLPLGYGDPYLKKAMLFLGFLVSYLRNQWHPHIKADFCAYADYQVPNVLRHFGVLVYSDELSEKIARRELLVSGGPEETAIRAATVLACEVIAAQHEITAAQVDWWCFQQRKLPQTPFHLTLTTHY